MKKAALHNLGCKVNSYELDAIMQQLINDGYEIVPFEDKADIYVVNTCSVTNIADRKSRQMLHKAKKNNPDATVVAIGCYVQTATIEALEKEGIDLCIGNNNKGRFGEILKEFIEARLNNNISEEKKCDKANGYVIHDLSKKQDYDQMEIVDTLDHSRAFIKIQDGCNQFCTYCIIPYARGRVRSRNAESIINEITELTKKGYKEFVITGIHLSSYGTDFEYEDVKADRFGPEHILDVLEKVNAIEGVKRIRLGSLEPRIITESFLDRLVKIEKICPHFHLSLQSGCNDTLKRMNRHYSAEEFYEKCVLLRKYFNHPAITTDVITGFPGETEEEFAECKAFLEKVDFYEMHIFKYSKRAGTPAATMKGQLQESEKAKRSDELEIIEKASSNKFRQYYVGTNVEVLFEEKKQIDGELYWVGHTKEYVKVAVKEDASETAKNLENEICNVFIEGFMNNQHLLGIIK